MNVRLSIVLVLILTLIGGSVFITRELSTKEPEPKEPWLFKISTEDITGISVTHRDDRADYALVGARWVIKDGTTDTPVFQDKWSGSVTLLSGPRCARAVIEEIDDPAKYGLDEPQATIHIIDKAGFSLDFHLGDPTPNGKNWYARLVGSNRLCTLPSVYAEVVTRLATEPPYPPTPEPPAEGQSG